jgi:hypothetical protein
MTRKTGMPVAAPADLWGQGITFWCRVWQAQLDQSLKFWALWASSLPRPSAADLSAEAEALRNLGGSASTPRQAVRPPVARVQAKAPATVH